MEENKTLQEKIDALVKTSNLGKKELEDNLSKTNERIDSLLSQVGTTPVTINADLAKIDTE